MAVRERVDVDEALRRVQAAVGDKVENARVNLDAVDLVCSPESLVEVLTALRDSEDLGCVFFTFLSAIDRSEFGGGGDAAGRGGLEVLIHVYSPENVIHVTLHVPVGAEQPRCPTISGLYKGALWHERECREFYGIDFEGHPNLVNLYLPEDFDGHPGLRSFRLPSRALIKPWPGAKDPEEAAAGGR